MRARILLAVALVFAAAPSFAQRSVPDAFVRPEKGHCIACHQLPGGVGPATRADLGPRLDGAAARALGTPRLRALISDSTVANPGTVMPPFGRHRILETAEIDQLVEFLHALP